MYVWLHTKSDKKIVNRCFNKGVSLETIFIIKKKIGCFNKFSYFFMKIVLNFLKNSIFTNALKLFVNMIQNNNEKERERSFLF